jgi:hypothetical protein
MESDATPFMHHEKLNLELWKSRFPLADFERQEGPRQFNSTRPGDPLDLWKASGEIISSPAHIAVTEQVRARAAGLTKLGRAVPVDIFVWAAGPPPHSYLTKIGGVPHRERGKPWPTSQDGRHLTFVFQICFLDSRDIVSKALPGDVLLVFFKDADSYLSEDIYIEWSPQVLNEPMSQEHCPPAAFRIPELMGILHRTVEYPDAEHAFQKLGHYQHWLFATTQSTKIGRETWFIQNDPRRASEELLCTFNSLQPTKRWPLTNLESLAAPANGSVQKGDFNSLMFGDVGCLYFLIDRHGKVRWEFDCY